MKRFFCRFSYVVVSAALLSSLCLFSIGLSTTAAMGADMPYVVIGEEVWLYDSDSGKKLFILPTTYYAAVENMDDEYYYVAFNGVTGKVLRDSVSVIGYHGVAPSTVQEIKIDTKYNIFTEIKLKSTLEGKSDEYAVPTNDSMYFLGKYPSDDMWYYVKYNENCGYVKAEYTSQPEIYIADFVPEKKEEPSEPADEPVPDDSGSLAQILVITGVCVAVVAVIIIIFLPKKKGSRYYYEDTEP